MTKICSKCGIEKDLKEFHKRKDSRFGVRGMCKLCKSIEAKGYREARKIEFAIRAKVYRKSSKKRRNIYNKKRRKADSMFRLNGNIVRAIGRSLKGNKNGCHWEDLVGYTLDRLKKHLEKQFDKNMNWDNYGKDGWHIDHKIPKAVFNFTKLEHRDFKRCWALKNLQPMWAEENYSKGAKLNKLFQPSLLL